MAFSFPNNLKQEIYSTLDTGIRYLIFPEQKVSLQNNNWERGKIHRGISFKL
jgi:hypothetical protein